MADSQSIFYFLSNNLKLVLPPVDISGEYVVMCAQSEFFFPDIFPISRRTEPIALDHLKKQQALGWHLSLDHKKLQPKWKHYSSRKQAPRLITRFILEKRLFLPLQPYYQLHLPLAFNWPTSDQWSTYTFPLRRVFESIVSHEILTFLRSKVPELNSSPHFSQFFTIFCLPICWWN